MSNIKAALELRRLRAENEQLRVALAEVSMHGKCIESAEPVAWSHNLIDDNIIWHRPADIDRHPERWTPLYTSPPRREWVGLTDEEIDKLFGKANTAIYLAERLRKRDLEIYSFGARDAEAALKEKNHD